MSAGALFQAALRLVNRHDLSTEANRDVLHALESCRTKGPLAFFLPAAEDAGLDSASALSRGAALYVGFCGGNVCDDLIDGECTYLEMPLRTGPSLQYQLQFIMVSGLARAGLPAEAIANGCAQLARAASHSHREVRTTEWTEPVYKEIGEEIAGRPLGAFLSMLWWGTHLEARAMELGRRAGIAAHVVSDIVSKDRRFTSMPLADRTAVREWARSEARALLAGSSRTLVAIARSVEAKLDEVS